MARSEPQATPPAEINPLRAQMVEQLTAFNAQVSAVHQKFLAMQQQAMSRLLNLYESVAPGSEAGGASDAGVDQALAQPTAPPLPAPPEPPAQSAVEAPQIESRTVAAAGCQYANGSAACSAPGGNAKARGQAETDAHARGQAGTGQGAEDRAAVDDFRHSRKPARPQAQS